MIIVKVLSALASKKAINEKALALANNILKEISPANLHDNDDYRNLQGKTIILQLDDNNLTYALQCNEHITVADGSDFTNPDLTIKASVEAISSLLAKEEEVDTLTKRGEISIQGEQGLLISLINLSARIDYSLENILAQYVGDVPAYFLDKAGRRMMEVGSALLNFITGIKANPEMAGTPLGDLVNSFAGGGIEKGESTNPITGEKIPFLGHSKESQAKRAQEAQAGKEEGEASSQADPQANANADAYSKNTSSSPLDLLKELPQPSPEKMQELKAAGETILDIASSLFKAVKK